MKDISEDLGKKSKANVFSVQMEFCHALFDKRCVTVSP